MASFFGFALAKRRTSGRPRGPSDVGSDLLFVPVSSISYRKLDLLLSFLRECLAAPAVGPAECIEKWLRFQFGCRLPVVVWIVGWGSAVPGSWRLDPLWLGQGCRASRAAGPCGVGPVRTCRRGAYGRQE